MAEVDILVLDEPTSALDLKDQVLILDWIDRLSHEQGLTVIFTTHHPHHALAVADNVLLMLDSARYICAAAGDVLTEDSLHDLYGAPLKRLFFEQRAPREPHFLDDPAILIDMFDFQKVDKRIIAMQPAKPAPAIATGFSFREQLVVIVDPDRAVPQRPRDAHPARAVIRPYAGRQTIFAVVGAGDGLLLVLEFLQHHQWPENFLLHKKR